MVEKMKNIKNEKYKKLCVQVIGFSFIKKSTGFCFHLTVSFLNIVKNWKYEKAGFQKFTC